MGRVRLATVTPTFNEPSRLATWTRYYRAVENEIDLHIIVDDGSDRPYAEELDRCFPRSAILHLSANGGIPGAVNRGLEHALRSGAEYIAVWMCDFRPPPGTYTALARYLDERPDVDGIGPVILHGGTADLIEFGGSLLDTRRVWFARQRINQRLDPAWAGLETSETMHGGFHIVRRSTLERIGLQDARLFGYCDELDFGWRAKSAGLRFALARDVRVWHEHVRYGRALRPVYVSYLVSRNRMLVLNRHGRPIDRTLHTAARIAKALPSAARHWHREGSVWHAFAYLWGLWDGIRNRSGGVPPMLIKYDRDLATAQGVSDRIAAS